MTPEIKKQEKWAEKVKSVQANGQERKRRKLLEDESEKEDFKKQSSISGLVSKRCAFHCLLLIASCSVIAGLVIAIRAEEPRKQITNSNSYIQKPYFTFSVPPKVSTNQIHCNGLRFNPDNRNNSNSNNNNITATTTTATTKTATTTAAAATATEVALNKVLLSTGRLDSGNPGDTRSELIDLSSKSSAGEGMAVADYPIYVEASVGGLFSGNTPVFCGGYDLNQNRAECYTPGNQQPLTSMSKPRDSAASVMLTVNGIEALWITGGLGVSQTVMDSTEYLSMTGWIEGPDLPMPLYRHCMVKLDESTVILIGGSTLDVTAITHTHVYYNGSESWTNGPPLLFGKDWHVCGLVKDQSWSIVIVTGGGETDFAADVTQLLFISDDPTNLDRQWTIGPNLPSAITGASGLVTQDEKQFLVVGGHSVKDFDNPLSYMSQIPHKNIYSMSCCDMTCSWTTLDQQLATARSWTVAILVPENYNSC